ncbi:hypothetical protein [Halorubrum sp. Hd13]|uniref:hypothetical protein n=1 Tax=Halorubrum sp. Hd13 TaxID=1480728 RepID=UPI0011409301|nr:hypothetical protein [Halorubrum sp. Hd13]
MTDEERRSRGSLAQRESEIHHVATTVDRGGNDAKPDRRSSADRAHHNDTIVAVDEKRRARTEYQKPERNETWTVARDDAK